ncbi:MAG: ECF transporter S component [Lachnospiraceae bacterium]|nr:ECF transporter S component [Lachnospiraceae bacterium]
MTNSSKSLLKMVYSAVCLALAMILPFFLGQVQIFMQGISPMHIPALLCGLACGPWWGLLVGFIAPLLRSLIFSMPPMATAIPMAFELAAYGLIAGLLFRALKKIDFWPRTYVSMIAAMVIGRFVGGAAKAVVMGINGDGYSFGAFISAYFVGTSVGIVLHLIIVPLILFALHKAKLLPNE